MNWTDFSKQQPKNTGDYITYCNVVGYQSPYVLAWWNGTNFTNLATNVVLPLSVTVGGQIVQSCSVAFYSLLTTPP